MSAWLLDTNIVSHIIKGDRPDIHRKLARLPMEDIAISAVTEGELFYGLAKRNYPAALTERVRQFLLRVDVLPWDHGVTKAYGDLRAVCEAKGVTLAPYCNASRYSHLYGQPPDNDWRRTQFVAKVIPIASPRRWKESIWIIPRKWWRGRAS